MRASWRNFGWRVKYCWRNRSCSSTEFGGHRSSDSWSSKLLNIPDLPSWAKQTSGTNAGNTCKSIQQSTPAGSSWGTGGNSATTGTCLFLMVWLLPTALGRTGPMGTCCQDIWHQITAGEATPSSLYVMPQTGGHRHFLKRLHKRRSGKHATWRYCTEHPRTSYNSTWANGRGWYVKAPPHFSFEHWPDSCWQQRHWVDWRAAQDSHVTVGRNYIFIQCTGESATSRRKRALSWHDEWRTGCTNTGSWCTSYRNKAWGDKCRSWETKPHIFGLPSGSTNSNGICARTRQLATVGPISKRNIWGK